MEVDVGLLRTPLDVGVENQRQRYVTQPTTAQLTFVMSWADLRKWQPWINKFGYDWFEFPAVSGYARMNGDNFNCQPHKTRCISDLEITGASVHGYCQVRVNVEFHAETTVGA